MDWYIAKKDGVGIDISDPEMIRIYAELGYEIYKYQEVRVDDIDKEIDKLKGVKTYGEWSPDKEG